MPVLIKFTKFSTITVDVLEITSNTSCRYSSTDPVFISISCTLSCDRPIIQLNGNFTFNLIEEDVFYKSDRTCTSSSGTIPDCNRLPCLSSDSATNITEQIQGFIPAEKITSCMYTVLCKSPIPNCTQETKTFLLSECDNIPVPKCTVPPITSVKPIINMTTVTMIANVTQSILEVLPYTELLTSNAIEPTCDCTSFYDIVSTPIATVSLISISISCNMSSQLPHTTTSIITTTITSTTYSMCSSSVPVLTPETTFPTISLPQSGKSRS